MLFFLYFFYANGGARPPLTLRDASRSEATSSSRSSWRPSLQPSSPWWYPLSRVGWGHRVHPRAGRPADAAWHIRRRCRCSRFRATHSGLRRRSRAAAPGTAGRGCAHARLATQTDAIYFFFAVFFLAPALAAVFFAMRRLLGWQGRFNPSRD